MLVLKMAAFPYLMLWTQFLDTAMFHTVSVATLLTYRHNKVLLEGLSISIENTLAKKAGKADTVSMLK